MFFILLIQCFAIQRFAEAKIIMPSLYQPNMLYIDKEKYWMSYIYVDLYHYGIGHGKSELIVQYNHMTTLRPIFNKRLKSPLNHIVQKNFKGIVKSMSESVNSPVSVIDSAKTESTIVIMVNSLFSVNLTFLDFRAVYLQNCKANYLLVCQYSHRGFGFPQYFLQNLDSRRTNDIQLCGSHNPFSLYSYYPTVRLHMEGKIHFNMMFHVIRKLPTAEIPRLYPLSLYFYHEFTEVAYVPLYRVYHWLVRVSMLSYASIAINTIIKQHCLSCVLHCHDGPGYLSPKLKSLTYKQFNNGTHIINASTFQIYFLLEHKISDVIFLSSFVFTNISSQIITNQIYLDNEMTHIFKLGNNTRQVITKLIAPPNYYISTKLVKQI